jgi:hypothetical protein
MAEPTRVQRRRTPGWRKPAGVVIVDRTSKLWGNLYVVGEPGIPDRATAVRRYEEWLRTQPWLIAKIRQQLAGKSLCCPCSLDGPCHADVLLRVSAGGEP